MHLPDVPGTRPPRSGDAARLARWFRVGIRYSLRRATTPLGRAYLGLLLTSSGPMWPLIVSQKWIELRRPGRRYYFALDDTAVLALQVRRDGDWVLEDHSSESPGSGQGRALRDILRPHLLAALDAGGRGLHITAADVRLANIYIAEIPGLADQGPAWPRGRCLFRSPSVPPD